MNDGNTQTAIVTGSAGFIGFHLTKFLLEKGFIVFGIDNFNDYYDVGLKESRNKLLEKSSRYQVYREDLVKGDAFNEILSHHNVSAVFHLAAQAGVRFSLQRPEAYLHSNVDATLKILEGVRKSREKTNQKIPLMIASSSSVYGLSKEVPFKETDRADQQVSLYGVTKRTNELMAHSYAHLFDLNIIMLRFFTVYGPWGRPDMALHKFTTAILNGEKIELFNQGDMVRDFTFVSDIVNGMWELYSLQALEKISGFEIFNIGCGNPRPLKEFVSAIESALGIKAKAELLPFQPGDVYQTYADVSKLQEKTGYRPQVPMELGVQQFVKWFLEYYGHSR